MRKNKIELSIAEIQALLVKAGVRPTAQRIAVCQYVLCEADHPSAEDIKNWVDEKFPMMSLATVYNTVKVLVEVGLLREFRFAHSEKVIYDHNIVDHHHFLDEGSGKLFDVDADFVELKLKLPRSYRVEGVDLLLKGKKSV